MKATITTTSASGSQVKHKTFWVQGCFEPTVTIADCTGPAGSAMAYADGRLPIPEKTMSGMNR